MKSVVNTFGVDRTAACLAYLTGQNVPVWVNIFSYIKGDVVQTSNLALWRALQASTNQNPLTTSGYWTPVNPAGEQSVILKDGLFLGPPIQYPQTGIGLPGEANFGAYPIVDADYPIKYSGTGADITFQPFAVERSKLTYQTGFKSSNLDLTLQPRDNTQVYGKNPPYTRGDGSSFAENLQVEQPYADGYSMVSTGTTMDGKYMLQSMRQSFATTDWYLAPVTLFRFFMPTPGDVESYGAAIMFRGRVSEIEVDKSSVKVTVASLMEIFKQRVPSQTIQPGNRWAPYDFNPTPDFQGSTVSGGSGSYAWVTLTSFLDIPTTNELDEGWGLVQAFRPSDSSLIGQWWRRIYTNVTDGSDVTLYFIDPLPIDLSTVNVVVKMWKSATTSTNPDGPGAGMPYVPQPLIGVS